MALHKIPLNRLNQKFSVRLGKQNYKLQTIYRLDAWYIDILDSKDNYLVTALTMVQGIDLLEQYQHIIKGSLYVLNINKDERQAFGILGSEITLYWEDAS